MQAPTNPESLRQAALLGHAVQVLVDSIGKPHDITKDLPALREVAIAKAREVRPDWKRL